MLRLFFAEMVLLNFKKWFLSFTKQTENIVQGELVHYNEKLKSHYMSCMVYEMLILSAQQDNQIRKVNNEKLILDEIHYWCLSVGCTWRLIL